MLSVPARREQVQQAISRGLSQRRACALIGTSRSSLQYASCLIEPDAPVLASMACLSAQSPRYGYRRIQVFLARQGHVMSADRAWRLWKQAGLQVPRKRSRRRVASTRPRPATPNQVNQVWAYDFVFDACANGQRLKCLTVVDEFTREALVIDVAGSNRSKRVIEVLGALIRIRGAPKVLRSDNGPEFVSSALLKWAADNALDMALNDPGKPWQNGTTESFNGKFRDECLSMEWFRSREEARVVIECWRQHYNAIRPHSSLANLTPNAFRLQCGSSAQATATSKL